jgi:hypothetical protein
VDEATAPTPALTTASVVAPATTALASTFPSVLPDTLLASVQPAVVIANPPLATVSGQSPFTAVTLADQGTELTRPFAVGKTTVRSEAVRPAWTKHTNADVVASTSSLAIDTVNTDVLAGTPAFPALFGKPLLRQDNRK